MLSGTGAWLVAPAMAAWPHAILEKNWADYVFIVMHKLDKKQQTTTHHHYRKFVITIYTKLTYQLSFEIIKIHEFIMIISNLQTNCHFEWYCKNSCKTLNAPASRNLGYISNRWAFAWCYIITIFILVDYFCTTIILLKPMPNWRTGGWCGWWGHSHQFPYRGVPFYYRVDFERSVSLKQDVI